MNKSTIIPGVLVACFALTLGCKPKNTSTAVSGDAASKVYVAPGKYDEFYNFVSGASADNYPCMDCLPVACCV